MTSMLDILEYYCEIRGHDYVRLDGTTKIEDRQDRVWKWKFNVADAFLFICTAGCVVELPFFVLDKEIYR